MGEKVSCRPRHAGAKMHVHAHAWSEVQRLRRRGQACLQREEGGEVLSLWWKGVAPSPPSPCQTQGRKAVASGGKAMSCPCPVTFCPVPVSILSSPSCPCPCLLSCPCLVFCLMCEKVRREEREGSAVGWGGGVKYLVMKVWSLKLGMSNWLLPFWVVRKVAGRRARGESQKVHGRWWGRGKVAWAPVAHATMPESVGSGRLGRWAGGRETGWGILLPRHCPHHSIPEPACRTHSPERDLPPLLQVPRPRWQASHGQLPAIQNPTWASILPSNAN